MATQIEIALADMVKETSVTTGTSTFSLDGVVASFKAFVATLGDGKYTFYNITDGTDWEVGLGKVYNSAGDKLDRDKILSSSNSGSAVNWGAGTKVVRGVNPATLIKDSLAFNLSGQTTDATPTALDLYGISGAELAIPVSSAIAVHATIVATQSAGTSGTVGDSYTTMITGLVYNASGSSSLIGTPATSQTYSSAGMSVAVALTANDTDDTVKISVTGEANKTIEWNCYISLYEVS
jgi:hypothetical protein